MSTAIATAACPRDDWRRAGDIARFLGIHVKTVQRMADRHAIRSRRLYAGARLEYSMDDAIAIANEAVRPRLSPAG